MSHFWDWRISLIYDTLIEDDKRVALVHAERLFERSSRIRTRFVGEIGDGAEVTARVEVEPGGLPKYLSAQHDYFEIKLDLETEAAVESGTYLRIRLEGEEEQGYPHSANRDN